MSVFNYQNIKIKNAVIETMTVENLAARERVAALEKQISTLERQAELSDKSHRALSDKVKTIESKKNNYSEKIKELEDDKETKNLLDTQLPDDLKRLLDSVLTN